MEAREGGPSAFAIFVVIRRRTGLGVRPATRCDLAYPAQTRIEIDFRSPIVDNMGHEQHPIYIPQVGFDAVFFGS
ncbi:MAG: hypothetical protein JWN70_1264 [Planctomycetaceae bacterium]|nr:hypothetical protein [Planctomycetaceae bacterium]